MSTLAESFLDDLNDLDSESDDEQKQESLTKPKPKPNEPTDQDLNLVDKIATVKRDLISVATLRKSSRYTDLLNQINTINENGNSNENGNDNKNINTTALYDLVLESNQMSVDIDEEIVKLHRFIVDLYSKKFPELESMVSNLLSYVRVVQAIGNETDMMTVDLSDIIPQAQVMIVTVTGSTTYGQPLNEADLKTVMDACDEVLELDKTKTKILAFVEDRMTFIAPNISAILGCTITSRVLGIVGGLSALMSIPASTLQILGQDNKAALSGFGRGAIMPHTGLIYYCALVQNCPPELRTKAVRNVANKVILAARIDFTKSCKDGASGKHWHKEISDKIKAWQETGPGKTKRAMPVPDAEKKRRRGGKRFRKQKEKYEMTDVRKEANRLAFSTSHDEYGDSSMGLTFGMLGKEGSGKLRITKKEQKLLKKNNKKLKAINAGSSGLTNGLASSLAFTPVQGIELMNPEAQAQKIKDANTKYFGSGFKSTIQ